MNQTRLIALLSLSALLLVGCGEKPSDSAKARSPLAPPAGSPTALGDILEVLEFEEITGTLTPGLGGAMGRYLTTWDKNCWFGLLVPPDALPEGWPPVQFRMRIPTKRSYLAYPEISRVLIVDFEPDGEHFLAPLTVFGTWMPWEAPPSDTLDVMGSDGGSTICVPYYVPSIKRYRLSYLVDHFSDWRAVPRPPKQ